MRSRAARQIRRILFDRDSSQRRPRGVPAPASSVIVGDLWFSLRVRLSSLIRARPLFLSFYFYSSSSDDDLHLRRSGADG